MGQNIFDELRKELENGNLTKEQKARLIQKAGEEYNKQIDRELNWYLTKQYAGAALEIGSVALPLGATKTVGSFATKVAMPMLEKKIGKKLAKDITTSAISGAIGSSIYGIGRGLMEDKNILKTSLEDAVAGLGTGAAVGAGSANLQRMLHEINFQAYKNPEVLKQVGKKNARKEIFEYYKDYIHNIIDSKKEIGKFKYVRKGIDETISQKFDKALNVGNLKSDMKKAKYVGPEPLGHERKPGDNTLQFHRFRKDDTDYIIKELKSGELNYHISRPAVTDVKNPEGATALLGLGLPQGSGKVPPTKIISDYLQERNPSEWLNSQITTNVVGATHQYDQKFLDALNDFYIQAQQDAVPGVLKGGVTEYASPNLENYNNKKIYTMEEFENMSAEDYDQNKKEIHEQLGKIGLPTEEEVKSLKQETQNVDTDNQNGHWITKNGHHIFIENEKSYK